MQSALFILKCLSEGKDEGYLVDRFDNDEQLVRIWMNLLAELKLLMVNVVGEYVITNKGREYLQTYNPHSVIVRYVIIYSQLIRIIFILT